jgi:hypothetical protein
LTIKAKTLTIKAKTLTIKAKTLTIKAKTLGSTGATAAIGMAALLSIADCNSVPIPTTVPTSQSRGYPRQAP